MTGITVINAYTQVPAQLNQAERLSEEFALRGVSVTTVRNLSLSVIKEGRLDGVRADFCVYLDKDRVAAAMLEKSGMRLFNSASATEICDDKMLTHIYLSDRGIKMPDCVYAPLCYTPSAVSPDGYIGNIVQTLGFPLVAKMCHGSLGRGVFLLENEAALRSFEDEHRLEEHFYQRYIDCGGRDTRVIVIGGKFFCGYDRVNGGDFRSNIELGGKGIVADIPADTISICEEAASAIGLDYCGVDVLTDGNGEKYICEVNSNAFFRTAEKVCGKNIAGEYADHILRSL